MELKLNNIGIIKDSTISIDGLTVITGKNNSGKTTVGKALYYLSRANIDTENAYDKSRNAFILTQISNISDDLFGRRRLAFTVVEEQDNEAPRDDALDFLYSLSFDRHRRFSNRQAIEKELIDAVGVTLDTITLDRYNEFLETKNAPLSLKNEEEFKSIIEEAQTTYKYMTKALEDPNSFERFIVDRTKKFLNLGFSSQVRPIRNDDVCAEANLKHNGSMNVDVRISKDNEYTVTNNTGSYPFEAVFYIDNPFIIDEVGETQYIPWGLRDRSIGIDEISSIDITSYNYDLKRKIMESASDNFFDSIILQEKTSTLFKKINEILPGEFLQAKDGNYYVDDGYKLKPQNLATGSKSFFILKQLLLNGHIKEKTLVVLDEPESHLHPEWINKFAEILVLIIKELDTKVLLTTHSPNLLLALNYYSDEYGIRDSSHFYLAEKEENGWAAHIEAVDDEIGKAYGHLSLPLIEMNLMRKALEKEI